MKRETLDKFTERAIKATDAGKLIPPIVYLPKMLRANNVRLTVDHVRITVDPPTIAENHIRIAEADPLGFLMALMHGQPIPVFKITHDGAVRVEYIVAGIGQRERVAKFLAHKVTIRSSHADNNNDKTDAEDWDDIVSSREKKVRDGLQET